MEASSDQVFPQELRERKQWVVWRLVEREGETTKIPFDIYGNAAASNDPTTWTTFENVDARMDEQLDNGIGFVFSPEDPFTGIDLDDCLNDDGSFKTWAELIVKSFNTYTERSPSGNGVKMWIRGKMPAGAIHRIDDYFDGGIEVYDSLRFFTMTGQVLEPAGAIVDGQVALEALCDLMTRHKAICAVEEIEWKDLAPTKYTDDEIIARAKTAKNADKFVRLMDGDTSGNADDDSRADLALCSILAFHTSGDRAQIERIFSKSRLSQRKKWQDRKDYRDNTIDKACNSAGSSGVGGGASESRSEIEYPTTDVGNAELFANTYAADLRYVSTYRKWFVWNGKQWMPDDREHVNGKAMELVRHVMPKVAAAIADDDKRTKYFKHVAASQQRNRIDSMLALARTKCAISAKDLDKNPWLFNCQNGTFDCKARTLKPHCREDYITKISPCDFNPDAKAPTWELFLARIFRDHDELIPFMQRALGYSLTGNVREQCLFILFGIGKNGKSTLINAVDYIMGDYGQAAGSGLLMADNRNGGGATPEIARLFGTRFVFSTETREGKSFDEERVKSITGGDKIVGRHLYADLMEFEPTHKIFLSTNHRPTIRGTDDGIWRRLNLIPFDAQIGDDERIEDFHLRLIEEADGVLAWMVEGLMAWLSSGLQPPAIVKQRGDEYRQDSDLFGHFISDACVVDKNASATIKQLYAAYTIWSKDNGNDYKVSKISFGKKLKERGYRSTHKASGHVWIGIGIAGDKFNYMVADVTDDRTLFI